MRWGLALLSSPLRFDSNWTVMTFAKHVSLADLLGISDAEPLRHPHIMDGAPNFINKTFEIVPIASARRRHLQSIFPTAVWCTKIRSTHNLMSWFSSFYAVHYDNSSLFRFMMVQKGTCAVNAVKVLAGPMTLPDI